MRHVIHVRTTDRHVTQMCGNAKDHGDRGTSGRVTPPASSVQIVGSRWVDVLGYSWHGDSNGLSTSMDMPARVSDQVHEFIT